MSNAVDELRRQQAAHRATTDAHRKQLGQRAADARDGREEADIRPVGINILGGQGALPSLFGLSDLILLLVVFIIMWVVLKAQHDVDIASMLWEYIKPNYDPGLFDDASGAAGDL